MQGQV